jgi:predicted metal-dependent TIM-barrel fold hydrolase
MKYIEPHGHMVSRVTDDYERMAMAGCAAICEPAFWAGFDRASASGFYDYFRQITEYEPRRAARFGIRHYCWLCINPKEAEDLQLAEEVIGLIPEFLAKPGVLGIGEIGLNKNSRNELRIFERHLEVARAHDQLVLIHTPHLEDKLKGTRLIVDALRNFSGINPERVIIDHVEEHTVDLVLDAGFWAGITLYPESKCTPHRAIDMLERRRGERIWINSACDWGVRDPLAVPKAMLAMRQRGWDDGAISRVVWENPRQFMGQNPRFQAE